MKIAIAQMDVKVGKVKENFDKAKEMIREAGRQGADLAVLPELWSCGYTWLRNDGRSLEEEKATLRKMIDMQERMNLVDEMRAMAAESRLALVLGSIPIQQKDRIYNTSILIDQDGQEVGRYSKIHRFRLMNEHHFLAPGEDLPVYELGGIGCGIQICYDLRFPEAARTLVLRGSQILIYPSQWPDPRRKHFETLLLSRAIENQCFVVAVNRVGQSGDQTFFGHSTIVGPWGELLIKAGNQEGVWCSKIEVQDVRKARETIPCFDDRRQRLYEIGDHEA